MRLSLRLAAGVAAFCLALPPAHAAPPEFEEAQRLRVEADTAELSGDLAAAASALEKALKLRPDHPGLLLDLASVQARAGRPEESIALLGRYAAMGLVAPIDRRNDFATLKDAPGYAELLTRLEANAQPVGAPQAAYSLGDGKPLFEDVAVDTATGRLFASSVRRAKIVVLEGGTVRDFARREDGLWSVYGLAIDAPRNLLWAASSAGVQTNRLDIGQQGAAGLFAFDLASGELKHKVTLAPALKSTLGDVVVAPDGTVYATDSVNPILYRLPPGGGQLERFISGSRFVSLQGLALSADGTKLAVADYALGLFVVDLATRRITPLAPPKDVTLLGLDGLSGTGPLVATQNGVRPQRVLRIDLAPDWSAIEGVTVLAANAGMHDDIALGEVVGPDFLYIANSQWNRFGDDGSVIGSEPFKETVVAKVPVGP